MAPSDRVVQVSNLRPERRDIRLNPRPASRKPLHLLQFNVGAIPRHPETARCRAAPVSEIDWPGTKEAHEVQERRSGSPGLGFVCWSRYWSNFVHQQLY